MGICSKLSEPQVRNRFVLFARVVIDTRARRDILAFEDKMDSKPLVPPHASTPIIEAYKKDVDRTLIRENLRLSPEERLLKLMELQRFADELRRAGRQARSENQ